MNSTLAILGVGCAGTSAFTNSRRKAVPICQPAYAVWIPSATVPRNRGAGDSRPAGRRHRYSSSSRRLRANCLGAGARSERYSSAQTASHITGARPRGSPLLGLSVNCAEVLADRSGQRPRLSINLKRTGEQQAVRDGNADGQCTGPPGAGSL